jgi:hypothetical protein
VCWQQTSTARQHLCRERAWCCSTRAPSGTAWRQQQQQQQLWDQQSVRHACRGFSSVTAFNRLTRCRKLSAGCFGNSSVGLAQVHACDSRHSAVLLVDTALAVTNATIVINTAATAQATTPCCCCCCCRRGTAGRTLRRAYGAALGSCRQRRGGAEQASSEHARLLYCLHACLPARIYSSSSSSSPHCVFQILTVQLKDQLRNAHCQRMR